MKKIILAISCLIILLTQAKADNQINEDPVKTHRPRSILTTQEAVFMINTENACIMRIKEGKAAKSKSGNASLRNYAALMIKENTLILSRVRKLAYEKKFILTSTVSKENQEALIALNAKNKKEFDRKFVSLAKADYKKDVKEFRKASRFNNKQISLFASEQLPIIQSQLDKLKSIKK